MLYARYWDLRPVLGSTISVDFGRFARRMDAYLGVWFLVPSLKVQ